MTQTNKTSFRPRSLTRAEAIAHGCVIDLMKTPALRKMVVNHGFDMPIAITYSVNAEFYTTGEVLTALKSALPFASCQNTAYFLVPSRRKGETVAWMKVIQELEGDRPVLTIMMPNEGIPT